MRSRDPPRAPQQGWLWERATLITSQLPIDSWHEVVGEPTFADAILARIVHNAYRLEHQGESMRKLHAVKPAEAPLDRNNGK